MAKIVELEDELILKLSLLEKIGAFRKSIHVPKNSLVRVTDVADPWHDPDGMQGRRSPGTGIPRIIMLGTLRKKIGKDFAAVYGRGSAKVYHFEGQEFDRWFVTDK
jgi:hypothetical protein